MGWRVIVEFNLDQISRMTAADFEALKLACLHYPDTEGRYRHVSCARILAQRHHSDQITLKIK